jgi:penicillin-binding protein 2
VRPSPGTSSADEAESTGLRLTFLTLLVVSLFVLLFARLWFLQVMAGERYADLAVGNAVRTITVEAPRGKILDRDGDPIVRNRHAKVVSVQPAEMGEDRDAILADLAELLGLSPDEVAERVERSRVSPFRPKPIAVDVPDDIVFYIHENRSTRFPGVYAETLPLRVYEQGSTAAHIVGYLGEISAEELESEEYEGYRAGELIGWAGLERVYEEVLRGEEGQRQLEVNARGQVLRDLREVPPTPGSDLVLTLDLDAQQLAEEALADGLEVARRTRDEGGSGPLRGGTFRAPAGAVVVLDAATSAVVAMASYPTFEPDRFVGGISQADWTQLQDPDNHYPLINRAIQSAYPPGSVYKIIPAAAALEEGYMSPGSTLPCPGSWEWAGSRYNNWRRVNSGPMDVAQSLVQSCDTVYYELAKRMWEHEQATGAEREILTEYSEAFGLGRRQGIDLPAERAGVVPSRAWKREFWENARDTYCSKAKTLPAGYARDVNADLCEVGFRWRGGDAVNMSIGQGEVLTTPLQVANSFAAVANGGTLHRPRVVKEIVHRDGTVEQLPTEELGTLPVSAQTMAVLRKGLEGVTEARGTAGSVFGSFPLKVAGKTGTAELKPKQPFAWFAGYAPADDPEYVVVAMLEEGGGGSQTAAPIVKRVFEGLFDLQPTDIDVGARTD